MDRQEQRIKGVTAGSEIPVYRMYVGTGANQTRLKDVRKTLPSSRATSRPITRTS